MLQKLRPLFSLPPPGGFAIGRVYGSFVLACVSQSIKPIKLYYEKM